MSIVYSGYIFDKDYSMLELKQIMDEFRKIAKSYCEKAILQKTVDDFLYFYHYREVHSDKRIQNLIEKLEMAQEPMATIWKYVFECNWPTLFSELQHYIRKKIDDFEKYPDILDLEYDYRCELAIIPTNAGILVEFFGNNDVEDLLGNSKYLKNFSYSNSIDRPKNISEKEWELRMKTWKEALSPDYIPMNHGFLVQLFDTKHIAYKKDLSDIELPSPDDLIRKLRNTFYGAEDLPNYPGNDSTMFDYTEFYNSKEFKIWQENMEKETRERCHFFSDKKELLKLIETTRKTPDEDSRPHDISLS